MSSWANQSAAIVTFFVEPVKLSWNQYAENYNGDQLKLSTVSHEGAGLEFPDYYVDSNGSTTSLLNTFSSGI